MKKTKEISGIKGITLIALVITIIILLILTTVTIVSITGDNGILKKALLAKNRYKNSQEEENARLNEIESQIPGDNANLPENTADTNAGTQVKLPDGWYIITAGYVSTTDGSIVKKSIKTANVSAVSDGNSNTIPVPNGFYYVGGTLSSGVVISDNKEDQNKYAGKADVPAGVAYNSDGTVNASAEKDANGNKTLKGNQFVWIPVSGTYEKKTWGSYNSNSWDTSTNSVEYKAVTKYGGFYVGRYEAGVGNVALSSNVDFAAQNTASGWQNSAFSLNSYTLSSGSISEKAGEIPYYHSDFKTAQVLSRNMYNTDAVKSVLVTGTMWDSIMKFIAGSDDSTVEANSSWGNYNNTGSIITYTAGQGRYAGVNSSNGAMTSAFTTSDANYHYGIRTCGSTEGVKKNNLYDIAGNLWEWTEENVSSGYYMLRGGGFNDAYASHPACYRVYHTATGTDTDIGFRPALYIM